jgi:hypothetical protein
MKGRWPRTRTAVGVAAGVAAFAATAVLALTRNGGAGSAPLTLAALSTVGKLPPLAAAGPLGPEGVPIPGAAAGASARRRPADRRHQLPGG